MNTPEIEEARMISLEAALKQGLAWRCEHCNAINGNHNQLCSDCRWPSDANERLPAEDAR